MTTTIRLALVALCLTLSTARALAVTSAAASDVIAPVHLHSHTGEVTITDSVSGTVNVGTKFLSVDEACWVFEFSGEDLLDPGDWLSIFVDDSYAGGFLNPTPVSQAGRTVCYSEIPADFLDGKAQVEFIAVSGSVAIDSVTLLISGSPR